MSGLYRYCGLTLRSALPLPELPQSAPDAEADLTIRLAEVPPALPGALHRAATYELTADQALWRLEGVGRYRVHNGGRAVDIEPARGADPADLRLFLLHPVFALASVLRGDHLLNAAAVEVGGRVIAFTGPSACGKSSAAALFTQQGGRLVSDALLRVTFDADGTPLAHPQAPWLQLWPDALRALDLPGDAPPPRHGIALRRLPLEPIDAPLPLARVALLREQRGNDPTLFTPSERRGTPAFTHLAQQSAGNLWIDALPALRPRHFQWCTRLAQAAAVERLELPWGWRELPRLREALLQWAASTP